MKRLLLLPLLAAFVCMLTACGQQPPADEVPTAATTRAVATRSEAASAAASTAATTAPSTTVPATTKKPQVTTAPSTTAPTTRPNAGNIPADTITSGNINPNLGAIQGYVQSEVDALAVTSVSVNPTSLTLEKGETATLEVSVAPSYANHRKCSVQTDSDCVSASYGDGTVSIAAVKAGTCTVAVTSHNGLHAYCVVTVQEKPEEKPEPPTEAPTTEPLTTQGDAAPTE